MRILWHSVRISWKSVYLRRKYTGWTQDITKRFIIGPRLIICPNLLINQLLYVKLIFELFVQPRHGMYRVKKSKLSPFIKNWAGTKNRYIFVTAIYAYNIKWLYPVMSNSLRYVIFSNQDRIYRGDKRFVWWT